MKIQQAAFLAIFLASQNALAFAPEMSKSSITTPTHQQSSTTSLFAGIHDQPASADADEVELFGNGGMEMNGPEAVDASRRSFLATASFAATTLFSAQPVFAGNYGYGQVEPVKPSNATCGNGGYGQVEPVKPGNATCGNDGISPKSSDCQACCDAPASEQVVTCKKLGCFVEDCNNMVALPPPNV